MGYEAELLQAETDKGVEAVLYHLEKMQELSNKFASVSSKKEFTRLINEFRNQVEALDEELVELKEVIKNL